MLNYSQTKSDRKQVLPQWFHNPEVDLPLLNAMAADNTELGPESVLKDSKYNPLLKPFELEWIFGFDVNVPSLNLTTEYQKIIFYCASNVGILYDYCAKEMTHLNGHQSKIVSVSADRSGRWLATADNGTENAIMIWDTTSISIVWTIFNHPTGDNDLLLIALSPNAKLLVTISNKTENTIDFWLWTYGNDEPDDSYTDDRNLGSPKSIEFHPNNEDHIMVVFEKTVLLFYWDYNIKKICKITIPKVTLQSSLVGHYTDSTYVNQCHESFVSTSKGCILVFGNSIYTKNYEQDELDNEKIFIKCVKISKTQINCLTTVDDLIVTGDGYGSIKFFDKRLKLLFWFSKEIVASSIKSISFQLNPKKYKLVSSRDVQMEERSSGVIDECIIDRSEENEILIREKIPEDATLEHHPFITRDFLIKTNDGTIYIVNFPKKELIPLFPTTDSQVASIDVHEEKPLIVIAYTKGRLILYNFETHEEVVTNFLPETEPDVTMSTVKFSPKGLHLACGCSNGELWFLQPILLTPVYVDPFKLGEDKIMKIAFSKNATQMAYYDTSMAVYAFWFDAQSDDWVFKGKVRSHYKEISTILFLDEEACALYSIGKDRYLIRYTNIANPNEEIDIYTRDRIEQKDIPLYFQPYPKGKFSKSGYFLISDDKHKYKIVSTKTSMCTAVYLGPAYGCFRDSPIRKMKFLPYHGNKYIIFMTQKHLGIQLMPIDGNPFKYVGCLGHPEQISDFQISSDGRYVFTFGKNERTVFKWKVRTTSVETMHVIGGLELQPFYCLIEGGKSGYLYQEMRDLFYYMQILQQGEQISSPRMVSNCINLGELPDLMRACGYYPSEYEIENLLTDLRYKDFDTFGILKDKVTFCEFVKLFINHKPAYGYSIEGLEKAFETVTTFTDEFGGSDMPREDFIEAITTTGEQVSNEQIYRCLSILLHETITLDQNGERDFSFLPDTIDFDFLTDDILGLNLDEIQRLENEEEDDVPYYSYYR